MTWVIGVLGLLVFALIWIAVSLVFVILSMKLEDVIGFLCACFTLGVFPYIVGKIIRAYVGW